MWRLRTLAVVCAAGLFIAGGVLVMASADTKLISGSCTLELKAVRTTSTIDVTTPTAGLCVTSDGTAEGRFTAEDLVVNIGTTCALGGADGGGGFDLEFGPFDTLGWGNLEATVVYAEPDIQLVFEKTDENSSIVAVGTFVQSPTSDSDCDSASGATFTWSGTLVFEDPVFE